MSNFKVRVESSYSPSSIHFENDQIVDVIDYVEEHSKHPTSDDDNDGFAHYEEVKLLRRVVASLVDVLAQKSLLTMKEINEVIMEEELNTTTSLTEDEY